MQKKSTNHKTFVALLLVFSLPVLLAYLALKNDWFNLAITNKGILLNPSLDFSPLADDETAPKWRLVYLLPADCDTPCENALYSLGQVWLALGKNMDRAEALVLITAQSDPQQRAKLTIHPSLRLLSVDQQNVKKVFKHGAADAIFLVDTLNNVILQYPLQQEQQQAVLASRDILADLRKLLKLSRIG